MRDTLDLLWGLVILLFIVFISLVFVGECIRLVSVIVGHPIDIGPITITGTYVEL